ncbi:MAG: GNAT family N-acetyltransferase [Bacteroidota bacterium]|nr:GNAT family N-acetyltransferase [Bacteroidota bacterium]
MIQLPNYLILPQNELYRIKPLWEKLNEIHLRDSVHFKDHYSSFTFEKRIMAWTSLPDERVWILVGEVNDEVVGYCVATSTEDGKGEIDSLCVDEAWQNKGVGETLVRESLAWLESQNCSPIRLIVSYGHESVMGFYEKLGFYPRATILELKNPQDI